MRLTARQREAVEKMLEGRLHWVRRLAIKALAARRPASPEQAEGRPHEHEWDTEPLGDVTCTPPGDFDRPWTIRSCDPCGALLIDEGDGDARAYVVEPSLDAVEGRRQADYVHGFKDGQARVAEQMSAPAKTHEYAIPELPFVRAWLQREGQPQRELTEGFRVEADGRVSFPVGLNGEQAILTVQLAGSASAEPTEARMREALLKIARGAEEMVCKWPDVTGDIFNLIAKEARAALSESPVRAEPEPSHELLAYFREDRRRLAEGLRDATNYLRLATMWTVDSDLHAKLKHAHSRATGALSECPVPAAEATEEPT
jgi:hypothetical protein